MYPAMQQAFRRLQSNSASIKHVIVLTDGQTQGTGYEALARQMYAAGISVSCMAVGTDADQRSASLISAIAGGQYYKVISPTAIPRVVVSETRRIARPLIFENTSGFRPEVSKAHVVINSISRKIPPITGFVLSTPKENALVENLIHSPLPAGENYPVLSVWQYGLGRTAAWTTDSGQRWSDSWSNWS